MPHIFYENRNDMMSVGTIVGSYHPLHLHRSTELVYVISGEGYMEIDHTKYVIPSESLAFILPFVSHNSLSKPGNCVYKVIMHQPEFIGIGLSQMSNRTLENIIIPKEDLHHEVHYVIQNMSSDNTADVNEAYLRLLYARIMPLLNFSEKTDTHLLPIIEKISIYLAEHYTEPLTRDILSKELGINKSYLSKIFSQVFESSFNQYLNNLRIEYAKYLLENTKNTILDISLSCGFDTERTFERAFKSVCSLTPSNYRKLCFMNESNEKHELIRIP